MLGKRSVRIVDSALEYRVGSRKSEPTMSSLSSLSKDMKHALRKTIHEIWSFTTAINFTAQPMGNNGEFASASYFGGDS